MGIVKRIKKLGFLSLVLIGSSRMLNGAISTSITASVA